MPDIILKLFLYFIKNKVENIINTDVFGLDFMSFMPQV